MDYKNFDENDEDFDEDDLFLDDTDEPLSEFYLSKENTALLVIDIQERLVPAMAGGEDVVKQAGIMLEAAKVLNLPVIVTEQYPKGLGPTVSELEKLLAPVEAKKIEKISYSALVPQLMVELYERDIQYVLVCGMETHVCVWQTVRDLIRDDFDVQVLADVVCSRRERDKAIALEGMRSMGAVITSSETALFDLLGEAGTPEFKAISQLIK